MKNNLKICPVCSSGDVNVFFEIYAEPVHCNVLCQTRQSALSTRRGDIRLGFCECCGHIYNVAFDPGVMGYTEEYENSLHFSPSFQDYARQLAAKLVEKHGLFGKDVIEIGCGKGDFLMLLSELGVRSGVGFDSSYVKERQEKSDRKITFIQDFYSERYSEYAGDMILSRHVLEHITSPIEFMDNLRAAIGDRMETAVFFEVPNILHTLRELSIWDIIYEHCSYFSPVSLRNLFHETGFNALCVEESFDGQFLCVEGAPAHCRKHSERAVHGARELKKDIDAFSRKHARKRTAWKGELERIGEKNEVAVIWGSGSKGATFLNAFETAGLIKYAIDINPHKHGKFVPGTGQEIVSPEFLIDYRPQVIILMNPIYLSEVWKTVRGMGLTSRILTA